jgi:hypothetical protein
MVFVTGSISRALNHLKLEGDGAAGKKNQGRRRTGSVFEN